MGKRSTDAPVLVSAQSRPVLPPPWGAVEGDGAHLREMEGWPFRRPDPLLLPKRQAWDQLESV